MGACSDPKCPRCHPEFRERAFRELTREEERDRELERQRQARRAASLRQRKGRAPAAPAFTTIRRGFMRGG